MRYTSAVLLGALAAVEVSAHNARHQSFHSRRQARRDGVDYTQGVDFNKVDYSNVDWSKVNYENLPEAPSTSAAPVVEQKQFAPAPSSSSAAAATSASATPASPKESPKESPATSKDAAKSSETKSSGLLDINVDLDSIISGVEDACERYNFLTPVNSKQRNDGMWLGGESNWQAEFKNDGGDVVALFCWHHTNYTAMFLDTVPAAIGIAIPPGKSQVVSFAEGVAWACSPMWKSTKRNEHGQIDNTWLEGNSGGTQEGAYNISREVCAHGTSITAKGKQCTSSMTECVFKCVDDSVNICGATGSEYDLFATDQEHCSGGHDKAADGTGGGCHSPADGDYLEVSLTN